MSLGSLLKDLGAIGSLLVLIWLILDGRLVTRGHLNDVAAGKNAEIAKAEAREAEWQRLAKRGTDEIAVPLAEMLRDEVRKQLRELRQP